MFPTFWLWLPLCGYVCHILSIIATLLPCFPLFDYDCHSVGMCTFATNVHLPQMYVWPNVHLHQMYIHFQCTFVMNVHSFSNVHLAQCTSFESIEFFNTPEPERPWSTDVEKGFVWTTVGHESVNPKASGKHYKIVWCFLMTRPQLQPKGNEILIPQPDSGTDRPSYRHGNVKWAWDVHPSSGKSCLFCISRRGPGIPSRREWVLV